MLAGAGVLGSLATIASAPASETAKWFEPAPRSEDGRFTNPIGQLLHGTPRARWSFFWSRIQALRLPHGGFPSRDDSGTAHFGAGTAGGSTVTWIGHSTLLIEMDGVRFLTDPIWSKRASPIPWLGPARLVEPGIAFDDLPAIDFVLISHNHYDHLDLPTLERLAERDPNVTFYVPLGNADLLRSRGIARVEELDWTERAIFAGVEIHCLPAQHWSKRSMTDDLETLWSSWAVIGPERRFYFAGDTGYFGGFAEVGDALGPFDLAAVPIGAYEPSELMRLSHMDPEEALRAAIDLGARTAVGIHFGTFELTDEPLAEPPQRFLTAASGQSPSLLTAWVLSIGEIRQF